MGGPYSFLPEVRNAARRASEATRAADRLGEALGRALVKLAQYDLPAAQAIRGEAHERLRGVVPHVASALNRLPLAHYAAHAAAQATEEAGNDDE